MTRGTVARRRRPPTFTVVEYGACASEADLDDCRQATHDALIGALGVRRRSGVRWKWCKAGDAPEVLASAEPVERTGRPEDWEGLSLYLAEHPEGFLVLAIAEAVRA